MDDYNHLHWEIFTPKARLDGTEPAGAPEVRPQVARWNVLPTGTDWYGRFRCEQNLANDYLIDWDAQKSWKSYTGIANGRIQDCAVTETMGPIYDRSSEHLGTTDALIIRMRKRMIDAAIALRDRGTVPPGVDSPEVYRQRSGEIVLPLNADWFEATRELRARSYAPA
jgi:hypothetical protein